MPGRFFTRNASASLDLVAIPRRGVPTMTCRGNGSSFIAVLPHPFATHVEQFGGARPSASVTSGGFGAPHSFAPMAAVGTVRTRPGTRSRSSATIASSASSSEDALLDTGPAACLAANVTRGLAAANIAGRHRSAAQVVRPFYLVGIWRLDRLARLLRR